MPSLVPTALSSDQSPDPSQVNHLVDSSTHQPIQIIVIEDDEVDAEVVRRALEMSAPGEFEIEHVRSLSEAIPKLSRQCYDLILLDLGLRDCSSLEAVESLVSFVDSPIVVLSGNDSRQVAHDALKLGAQDFVQKSENLQESLPKTLRFSIQRYRIKQDLHRTEELLAKQAEWERNANQSLRKRVAQLELVSSLLEGSAQFAAVLKTDGIEWANKSFLQFLQTSDCVKTPTEGFLNLPTAIETQFLAAFRSTAAFTAAWIEDTDDGVTQCKRIELLSPQDDAANDGMGFLMSIDAIDASC